MTNYRRYYVPGGTVFFTVNLAERSKHLLVEHIDRLREAFRLVKTELPFEIDAIVILPEHLHALWTLPMDDMDYSIRWKRIKREFSCRFPKTERRSASRRLKGERGIWQRRHIPAFMAMYEKELIRSIGLEPLSTIRTSSSGKGIHRHR